MFDAFVDFGDRLLVFASPMKTKNSQTSVDEWKPGVIQFMVFEDALNCIGWTKVVPIKAGARLTLLQY